MATKLDHFAAQLGALGNPVRLAILRFVVQAGPSGASAGAIQEEVELPASTLSHHLKRLVEAGILSSRLESTFHYYSVEYSALTELTNFIWEDCCKRGGGCCS
ncbi:MAG: helix-turn-helix transcriptional regulator [Polyangiaceae bacterium]|nr:helix-turn-helix transcriptional regulator [Polyangiaceae bacterium]